MSESPREDLKILTDRNRDAYEFSGITLKWDDTFDYRTTTFLIKHIAKIKPKDKNKRRRRVKRKKKTTCYHI